MPCLRYIEEMDGKVIIWSRFRHDIKKIKKALDKTYGSGTVVTFYGDTHKKIETRLLTDFKMIKRQGSLWVMHKQREEV
jgi:hypothetical protein